MPKPFKLFSRPNPQSPSIRKLLRLCLVTNIKDTPMASYEKFIQRSVQGGVTMVQLREKDMDVNAIKAQAHDLQRILKPYGVPLIINDFVELAAEIGADGVHIGQKDMDVESARKILGPYKIVGLSVESISELYAANKQSGLSYVTASAVFPSRTKPNCKKIWGLNGLKHFVSQSRYPVTAIGGINADNVKDVFKTGIEGVAVVGAIHQALDPYQAAQALIEHVEPIINKATSRMKNV